MGLGALFELPVLSPMNFTPRVTTAAAARAAASARRRARSAQEDISTRSAHFLLHLSKRYGNPICSRCGPGWVCETS